MLLIALNHPMNGQMMGIGGIDNLCFRQAREAGLDAGTFRAFLADTYQDIKYLLPYDYLKLPVANIKVWWCIYSMLCFMLLG